jgi:hypothetical protein
MTVRMLAHRGYLIEVGRRPAKWANPFAKTAESYEVIYESPAYALSETGLVWALANCDLDQLIRAKKRTNPDHRLYDLNDDKVASCFIAFARIKKWLDKPGWGESRYTFNGDL